MKRTIALVLAAILVCALFAACNKETTTSPSPSASTAATATPAPTVGSSEATPAPATGASLSVPEPPHAGDTLAVNADGTLKYELDANGYPTEWYDYELPLTTDNHTYTYWGTTLVGVTYLDPDLNTMQYYSYLREQTGVHLEYTVKTLDEIPTSFAIMMASQEFSDIMSNAGPNWTQAGGGAAANMIEQDYFINIADYEAYAPNFRYLEPYQNMDPELHNAIWLNDTMITSMGFLIENQLPGTGWVIRSDWLDRLDGAPKAADIKTYDQFEDVLNRFKNEIITEYKYEGTQTGYPFLPATTVEAMGNHLFGGMNTGMQLNASGYTIVPQVKVVPPDQTKIFSSNGTDRVVSFTLMDDVDYDALEFFLRWQDEGLLNPDFENLTETNDFQNEVINNRAGAFVANPSILDVYITAATDPNMAFAAMANPSKTGVWDSKFGNGYRHWGYFNGYGWSYSVSAPNIPLLVSYGDWFYSDYGSKVGTWGIEDVTYYYDDAGNQMLTDFVLHNDLGLSSGFFICLYSQNPFAEPIRQNHLRSYAYPGGEFYKDMFYKWAETCTWLDDPKEDHWNWPSNDAKLTDEKQDEVNSYMTDAQTYLTEQYWGFLNNVTPLTRETWDTYVKGALDNGFTRYQLAMQECYEAYMARR